MIGPDCNLNCASIKEVSLQTHVVFEYWIKQDLLGSQAWALPSEHTADNIHSFPFQVPAPHRYCHCECTKLHPAVFQGSPCQHRFRLPTWLFETENRISPASPIHMVYNTSVPIFYLGFVYPYSMTCHEAVPCYDLVECICWSSWIN